MMNQHREQPPGDMNIWILAGQSNMEGVGELGEALGRASRSGVFTSAGRWDIAVEPLHRLLGKFHAGASVIDGPGIAGKTPAYERCPVGRTRRRRARLWRGPGNCVRQNAGIPYWRHIGSFLRSRRNHSRAVER